MSNIENIVNRLLENNFEVYSVGGCVRDIFLGVNPSDYDITTNALPEEILEIFTDLPTKLVGKSFGVVIVDDFEVATFRLDREQVEGNARKTSVEFAKTIDEDLLRRDLTINAIAISEKDGTIVDLHNGVEDLRRKLIKFVGDPYERIKEDPNRVIRACRFLAKIEGGFDKGTLKALQDTSEWSFKHIAKERIQKEIVKAMSCQTASLFFSSLHLIGMLKFIFPELDKCVGHFHGTHHLEDIFQHNMVVGDSITTKKPLLKLAGYLHDIGKPESYQYSLQANSSAYFPSHEYFGYDIVRNDLQRLKFSNNDVEYVSNLVKIHMSGGLENDSPTKKALRRFRKKLYDLSIDPRDWLRLRIADRKGNISKDNFTITDIRLRRSFAIPSDNEDEQKSQPFSVKDLTINGKDVMRILNIPPSKEVGEILNNLLTKVVDGDIANERVALEGFVESLGNGLES